MNGIKKFYLLLLALCLTNIYNASAQEQMSHRDRAYAFYLSGEYAKAIDFYGKIFERGNLKPEEVLAVANSYRGINEYGHAAEWYKNYLSAQDKAEVRWDYAKVLKALGKYEEAKEEFLKVKEQPEYVNSVEVEVQGCDSAIVWRANPTTHLLKNEEAINTDLSEFAVWPLDEAVVYAGEPSVIEGNISGKTGQAFLKVYSASIDQDQVSLKYPNIMSEVFNDEKYHVGPITANAANDVLFVTRTNPNRDYESVKHQGMRFRKKNLELIIYKKEGDNWVGEPFPYNNVKEYSLGHAALSADEKTLYFASDMPGGMGGVDIWTSALNEDGSWGIPTNLGEMVNTAGDEMFPSVFEDTLYFSSNGHVGMGGLDIFKATGLNGNFNRVENLQYPINSSADDMAFVVKSDNEDIQYGYLSSNREGGKGSDDIYSYAFKKPKITITLIGKAYDKETNQLIDGVSIELAAARADASIRLNATGGTFEQTIDKQTAYSLAASKTGYMGDNASIEAIYPTKDTTVYVDFFLQPVHEKGIKFVLEDIYYDFDKHNIRPDAALILDKLVKVMIDNPTLKIELSSHTDSRGSDSYNMKLSERRAKSAVDYLISKGIAAERMVAKGYGETRLVNRCANGVNCTEKEHQQNRRTEIEVLDY